MVRVVRFELTRPNGHKHLKLACLPIPAYPHKTQNLLLDNEDNGASTPWKAPLSDCGTLHFGLHVTLVIDSSVVQRLAETVCVAPAGYRPENPAKSALL